MKRTILFAFSQFFIFAQFFCNENDNNVNKVLLLSFEETNTDKGTSINNSNNEPASIIISVKDVGNNYILNYKKLTLIKLGNNYLTENIEFIAGNYTITDFLVVNSQDSILYISPKVGSELENIVNTPLPLSCTVNPDGTTNLSIDVKDASIANPPDFGYAPFSFSLQNTLNTALIVWYPFDRNIINMDSMPISNSQIGIKYISDKNDNNDNTINFSGISDKITLNESNPVITTRTFTIATWVKIDGNGGSNYPGNVIFQQRDEYGKNSAILLVCEDKDNNIEFALRASENEDSPAFNLEYNPCPAQGEWHHYAATIDNDRNAILYLDGINVLQKVFPQHNGNFYTDITNVDIGLHSYNHIDRGALNGDMDDFRIYNRALTDEEIKLLYKSEQANKITA